MTTPDADPAALLAPIRADLHTARDGGILGIKAGDYLPAALARHSRTLLAAVEAVLELADELEHIETGPPSGVEDESAALGIRWCATRLREAITSALAGQGAQGG